MSWEIEREWLREEGEESVDENRGDSCETNGMIRAKQMALIRQIRLTR